MVESLPIYNYGNVCSYITFSWPVFVVFPGRTHSPRQLYKSWHPLLLTFTFDALNRLSSNHATSEVQLCEARVIIFTGAALCGRLCSRTYPLILEARHDRNFFCLNYTRFFGLPTSHFSTGLSWVTDLLRRLLNLLVSQLCSTLLRNTVWFFVLGTPLWKNLWSSNHLHFVNHHNLSFTCLLT